jgi:aromatic ring hydroxylase
MRDGKQYLSGLRDGRQITIEGTRVGDVTEHPAFRGMAGTMAEFMDLHADQPGDLLTPCPETGELIPWSYLLARDEQGVRDRGRYFEAIALVTGGLLGRSPDFLATLLASWFASAAVFGQQDPKFADNVAAHYMRARQDNLCHTHAISDPPRGRLSADNQLSADKGAILALRKVGETPAGIVVRGIKMLATFAPLADELLVYPFRPLTADEGPQALAFSIPMSTPGLSLLCRRPMARGAALSDAPLAERFDEMDALCLFEDVIIPHERIFIDGDVELANSLRQRTQMTAYLWHQSAIRTAVKAELLLGVASLVAKTMGRYDYPATRVILGEMGAKAEALRSLVCAAEAAAHPGPGGYYLAGWSPLAAAGVLGTEIFPRLIELLQLVGSSNLIMHPAERDLTGPAAAVFRAYFGSPDSGTEQQAQVLNLAAELAVGAFGGRQLQFERFYLGAPDALRDRYFQGADVGRAEDLVLRLLPGPASGPSGAAPA